MKRRIGPWAAAVLVVGVAIIARAGQSAAECNIPTGLFRFDFADAAQYPACFRDIVPGTGISADQDVGDTGHSALNITGSAGGADRTWLTLVDQARETPDADNVYGSGVLCADVINPFDSDKGAGVVTLFNERKGQRGLALMLYSAGNTGRLVLATVEGDPALTGKLEWLTSVSLGSLIRPNQWYRIVLTVLVDGPRPQIRGQVLRHHKPRDPNSDVQPIGSTLDYTPASLPDGVQRLGQSGVLGHAQLAVVNSSVTNFTNIMARCRRGLAP